MIGLAPGPPETLWIAIDSVDDRVDEIGVGVLKSRPKTDVLGNVPEMAASVNLGA